MPDIGPLSDEELERIRRSQDMVVFPERIVLRLLATIDAWIEAAKYEQAHKERFRDEANALSQELKAAREEREKLLGRHDYDGESWPYSKCKLCGADGMDWRHVSGHISRVAAAALTEPEENG